MLTIKVQFDQFANFNNIFLIMNNTLRVEVQKIYGNAKQYTIYYNEREDEYGITSDIMPIPLGQWDYGIIVDRLIKEHYPNGEMEAILNNDLLDPSDKENKAKFNEMQEYRNYAKEIAKQAMQYVIDNNL